MIFMKSLFDYPILVNDVFYRSEHILSYIERHPNMSELDVEAISNTIMDALVYKGLIDSQKESLDLAKMAIVPNLNHFKYQKQPNVSSIPLDIKEKMRYKAIRITGGIPVSLFFSRPAGGFHYCIYDMNTAISTVFTDFKTITCSYDSPTRKGIRATERPFIEVKINDTEYLIDALTKRIFKSNWFAEKCNIDIDFSRTKKEVLKKFKNDYEHDTKEEMRLANHIQTNRSIFSCLGLDQTAIPGFEEYAYELNKAKEIYPEEFVKAEQLQEEMDAYFAGEGYRRTRFKKD